MCICDGLFEGFKWTSLTGLNCDSLPEAPGVYVLRLVNMGELNIDGAIEFLRNLCDKAKWREIKNFASSRIKRLERLKKRLESSECPVLYIGSTRNLRNRCRDLAGKRHTVFLALLALLVAGTEIDYGYKIVTSEREASDIEYELKGKYRGLHGTYPPLVEK